MTTLLLGLGTSLACMIICAIMELRGAKPMSLEHKHDAGRKLLGWASAFAISMGIWWLIIWGAVQGWRYVGR